LADSRYLDFVRRIEFELIQPDMVRCDRRFTVARRRGPAATLFELPGRPYDLLNTAVGPATASLRRALRPACRDVQRMSTFAIGAILNEGVRRMRPEDAFVNVGTWHGFSLLAGMAGNPDRRCIGIDNFSVFEGSREAFMEGFEPNRGPAHRFFDMDYRDYFARHHEGRIGLYAYDGDHAYEHQLEGLRLAEPFFADDCAIVVDDTNWDAPRQATLDFVEGSDRHYEVLLDARTTEVWHPTFWNGVMVLRAVPSQGEAGREAGQEGASSKPLEPNPIDFASRSTPVSLIVCDDEAGGALEATLEAATAQTWPDVEVLIADGPGGVRAAFEASRGSFVALVDPDTPLEPWAVEAGLALPALSQYFQGAFDERRARLIRFALAAAEGVESAIPRDERFVLVGRTFHIGAGVGLERALLLWEADEHANAIDETAAIARIEDLRREGARFVAFVPGSFRWLNERPGVRDHMTTRGRSVLETEAVRVFELDRA
jgi:hypothetical protein